MAFYSGNPLGSHAWTGARRVLYFGDKVTIHIVKLAYFQYYFINKSNLV